jgi:Retroviral aspartyl protease
MLISGAWAVDDDGVTRPYLRGEVRRADGTWQEIAFLVDSGADQTVLTSQSFEGLGFALPETVGALLGLGGAGAAVPLNTVIRFDREDGTAVAINGPFAASVTPTALDTDVLGRDILNHFAVILDWPNGVIALLHPPHRYTIHST